MGDNIGVGVSSDGGGIKEQDRLLPIANVGRIMKHILPPNAKISKEAKETMQECVSEFISFVTSEASEKCRKERRKTVNGDDICSAMVTLGFDNYAGPLTRYLRRYREFEGDKSTSNQDMAASCGETVEEQSSLRSTSNRFLDQGASSSSIMFKLLDRSENASCSHYDD